MTISIGDKLPSAELMKLGDSGPETVSLDEIAGSGKVAIFAVVGAYTPTCSVSHVPSFIKNMDALKAKGVGRVICVSVNDPFVMNAWPASADAEKAGIDMLGDPLGEFTQAIGMDFSAPPAGLLGRSKRYAMLVEDGVVKLLNTEESPAECQVSAAETLLDQM